QALVRDRVRVRALDLAHSTDTDLWRITLDSPKMFSVILDLLCDIFVLEPRAQWWEALRVSFLPTVPQRITLFDQNWWKQVENAFAENKAGEAEIYGAAWQLLFDSWLYIYEYYKSPHETLFGRLAELTRDIDAPPLRIAHCIRDLAYGDESRTDDLVAMVQSDDPAYRTIFERCYWRPTAEEEAELAPETERKPRQAKVVRRKPNSD
ncbi:MAG: hypothetical protein M3347_05725, partial [Armatimonadota bacterium]|nr:hypothetical protein [Armatimonadota bacterium]